MATKRRPGFPMSRTGPYQVVRLQLVGRDWTADFKVEAGQVCVGSAYGCRRAPLGRRKAERVAEQLLREILLDYANGHRPSIGR